MVKRKGLETSSKCIVRVINSYLPPETTLLSLSPGTPTAEVLRRALRAIPDEWNPHVAIEVSRRWEVPNMPHRELLSMFAYCLHVLDALLIYVRELDAGPVAEDPATFVSSVLPPRCMLVDPSCVPLTFEADTGRQMRLSAELSESGVEPEEAARRYGFEGKLSPRRGAALRDVAEQYHEMARKIFKKDGYHMSMVYLFGPGDNAEFHVLLPDNRRDKFMMWHQLAYRVAARSFRSLIATSEIWMAETKNIPFPVPTDLKGVQGRREGLQTYYGAQNGTGGSFVSEVFRLLGKAYLKKPVHEALPESAEGFALPIRAVWKRMPASPVDGTRSSSADSHADDVEAAGSEDTSEN